MKSRSGFVSNSSSSSFIIVGAPFKIDYEDKEIMIKAMERASLEYDEDCPQDEFWDYMYNGDLDGLSYLEEGYIGISLARWDDCDEIEEINLSEFDHKAIQEKIKKYFDIDVEVKMYAGTTHD